MGGGNGGIGSFRALKVDFCVGTGYNEHIL